MGQYGQANLQPKVSTSELMGLRLRTRSTGSACAPRVACAARRLQQPVAEDRVGQLVEIAQQALHARIDQFLRDAVRGPPRE